MPFIPDNPNSDNQGNDNIWNIGTQLGGGWAGAVAGAGMANKAVTPLTNSLEQTGNPAAMAAGAILKVGAPLAGGVLGSGLGSTAANTATNAVRRAQGEDIPLDQGNPDAFKSAAMGEAIGVPAAKGLGFLAHPIAPFIKMVDERLAKSPKTIDFSQLLKDYESNVLPKLRQQGYGQEATDAFNKMRANIVDAVNAFKTHISTNNPSTLSKVGNVSTNLDQSPIISSSQQGNVLFKRAGGVKPGVKGPPGYLKSVDKPTINISDGKPLFEPTLISNSGNQDISSLKLPISQANQLKRNLTGKVGNYYGYDTGKANVESAKLMGSIIKNAIQSAEPAVGTPNAIAHALYQLPDIAGGLTHILPNQAARAVQSVGQIPTKILQKIIPQGGGYLNQVLPRIIQFSNMGDQQQ